MTSVILSDVNGKSRQVKLGRELNKGGAGTVYLIDGEPSTAVKIYNPKTLIDQGKIYADKIKCMLQSVPSLASSTTGIVQITWPLAIARDLSGNFVGFSMPTLDWQSTEGMASLLQPKLASLKFKRSDLGIRATVAANLAGVVSAIHDKGHQIVDLKPENLRLYRNGLYVAVLDCDGFQIQIPGQILSAPQVTTDYLAPEFQSKPVTKPEQQDRFALAVIIFKLLNFGVNPYQGIAKDPNAPTDIEGKISQGMYAYAKTPHRMIDPLPQSAHTFFPEELRKLFDRAFGSFVDKRPSAREWADVLMKYAQQKNALIKPCSHGHFWFTGLPCGECHRNGLLNQGQVIPPPPTSPLAGQRNGRFAVTFTNGERYDGYWVNDIIHGHGTYTWPYGDKYIGEYKDGKRNGRGTYIWANGDRYEGNWVNDVQTGHGILNYANGAQEEGEWLNGQLVNASAIPQQLQAVVKVHKKTKIKKAPVFQQAPIIQTTTPVQSAATTKSLSSSIFVLLIALLGIAIAFVSIAYVSHFVGYTTLTLISLGIGILVMANSELSAGIVIAILILVLSSAGKYSWNWVYSDSSKQGSIPVTQEDEDKLKKLGEEQIKKGMEVVRQQELKDKGSDVAKQISNQSAEKATEALGNNSNTESKNYAGTYTEANGNKYEGDIKDGKKNGRGTFTWANGDRYEGDWINNSRTGHGIYTWPNRNRYEGEFVNGKMSGRGTFTWANGDRYEGEFVDGKKNGHGTLTYPAGAQLEGNWVDDNFVRPQNAEPKKASSINDL